MNTKDKNRYIDRLFNIRPICFWAFFVALTVAVCLMADTKVLWVAVYFAVLFALFFSVQFLKCHDKVLTFFGTSRLNFVITITLCIAVACSFAITNLAFTQQKSYAGYKDIIGVVESHKMNNDGSGWFILSNAKFGSSNLSGKIAVYVNNPNVTTAENIKSTYRVSFNTQLRNAVANDYNINNGIKYTASVGSNVVVTKLDADTSMRSSILRYSYDFLQKYASNTNANFLYAMLFGDKSTLDGDINSSFSLTGMAHVLAVSGLHVGIIVGMLVMLLKLLHVQRKRQLWIIAGVLLFYCYLCGFRYSILRAGIMFMVFFARRAYLKSNDLLSSISAAAILILILFPYSLLSVSFQLSFACVLGIALFNLPFTNFFNKVLRVSKDNPRDNPSAFVWLSRAMAINLATTLACLPFMIKYFGYVSISGIFTNIIILPLVVIAFQLSVIAVLTWIAFPLLYLADIMLDVIISVTHWFAKLPFSYFTVSGGNYWFLFFFIGLIFASRFIFLSKHIKVPIALFSIGIYVLSVLL